MIKTKFPLLIFLISFLLVQLLNAFLMNLIKMGAFSKFGANLRHLFPVLGYTRGAIVRMTEVYFLHSIMVRLKYYIVLKNTNWSSKIQDLLYLRLHIRIKS
jgi:hypothetical protein